MKKWKQDIELIKRGFQIACSVDKTFIIFEIVTSIFDAISPFVPIWFSARIITELTTTRRIKTLFFYAVLTVALTLLLSIISSTLHAKKVKHSDLWFDKTVLLFNDINNSLQYEHLENPEVRFKREQILMQQCATGAGINYIMWILSSFLRNSFTIIISFALTIHMLFSFAEGKHTGIAGIVNSPYSILFIILIMGIHIRVKIWCSKNQIKESNAQWENLPKTNQIAAYYGNIIENYTSFMDIKIYHQESLILKELKRTQENPIRLQSLVKINMKYGSLATILDFCLNIIVYLYIAVKAYIGIFGIGFFIQYTATITKFLSGVSGLCSDIVLLFNNNQYLKKIFEYMDLPNTMYQGTLPVEKRNDGEYEIEFKNVSFRYPRSEAYALHNVSIKFRIGEKLSVVGKNGSGKTTFIKLLCRLYDPTEGEILLNGINIKKYDYEEYLSLFSVVFQDFKLFSFSLGQNVAAKVDYQKEKVEESLKKAGFGERYKELEKGTETCLYKNFDEKGVELSGGEAQKVAIARALYKDAPFIVLDEPTAALDPIAEYEIYTKLNELIGEKTAIYISHRLSSCQFCDKIAVFEKGEIIQQGTHEQLVKKEKENYYELWQAQAQYYTTT